MESVGVLDRAGRRRSPATLSGFHQGRVPRNKGLRYPPDPPTVDEIIAVMRAAGDGPEAMRLRGVIIVLWRAGLQIGEAPALARSGRTRRCCTASVRRSSRTEVRPPRIRIDAAVRSGQAAVGSDLQDASRFQRRLRRAYSRSGDGHPTSALIQSMATCAASARARARATGRSTKSMAVTRQPC